MKNNIQFPLGVDIVDRVLSALPHGSGIDGKWEHVFERGRDRFKCSFHCMDNNGMYCGWQDFEVAVHSVKKSVCQPLLGPLQGKFQIVHEKGDLEWTLHLTGYRNSQARDLRSYLYDVIEPTMTEIGIGRLGREVVSVPPKGAAIRGLKP
jgi:hypothetical protein